MKKFLQLFHATGRPDLRTLVLPERVTFLLGTVFVFALLLGTFAVRPDRNVDAAGTSQAGSQLHETLFVPGPAFNVGEVVYPSGHDFDTTSGIDTCLSLSVPVGDEFTLGLTWEALFEGLPGAGDLDLYLYLDSACTESALLTSSFNSNAYTGELLEITPRVRNIGSSPAVAGIRIGKRSGRGNPGLLQLRVLTGNATFLEHGTDGPPLEGQEGAPTFDFSGPFSLEENSPTGTPVGTVTAIDPQLDPVTFFELEPAAGQTTFAIDAQTGIITVEDPTELDRETTETLVYWIGVTDGATASLTSVSINLDGVNDNAPVALDGSAITAPDTAVTVTLAGTDADIDPAQQLDMVLVDQPSSGTVSVPVTQDLASASVLYTPAPGFLGTDTFTFAASDGETVSASATVTVTVTDDPTQVPTPTPGAGVAPTPAATVPGGSGGGPGGGLLPPTAGPPAPPPSLAAPPSAPRFVRATAGDSSAAFTWQRPLSDGGAPIEGYRIFNINTATSTIITGDVLEGEVFALQNGTSYLFQIRAFNVAGLGEAALVGPVMPVSGEPVPLDVQASVQPDDTITVWWAPPEGDFLKPVAAYQLSVQDPDDPDSSEVVKMVMPGEPLIVNVADLEGDKWHMFRVTALTEEFEVIGVGVSEPVYLPPTLASQFEPLPPEAILIDLTDESRSMFEFSLRKVAGGEGVVPDLPAVLILQEGVADLFIHVEDLHRALVLPSDFSVESDQLSINHDELNQLLVSMEIVTELRVSGPPEVFIDPSGILFRFAEPVLDFAMDLIETGQTATEFGVGYIPESLSPGFEFSAVLPEALPEYAHEALLIPSVIEIAEYVQLSYSGMTVKEDGSEKVSFVMPAGWNEVHAIQGNETRMYRVLEDGTAEFSGITCESSPLDLQAVCFAEFVNIEPQTTLYALIATSNALPPSPTPEPTTFSAPTEPSPTTGPSLVVVEDPTPEPTRVPVLNIQPTSTPESDEPLVPEPDSGGPPVVTWVMAGILGLIVVRGAYSVVGRIRS